MAQKARRTPAQSASVSEENRENRSPANDLLSKSWKVFSGDKSGMFKWTTAAFVIISMTTAITAHIQGASGGQLLFAGVVFVLLIVLLFHIEKQNQSAKIFVTIISGSATLLLVMSAAGIVSSIFLQWPLTITLEQSLESPRHLARIEGYDLPYTKIARVKGNQWIEKKKSDGTTMFEFEQRQFLPNFVLLFCPKRNIYLRIPTNGGIVSFTDLPELEHWKCQHQPCWADIASASAVFK